MISRIKLLIRIPQFLLILNIGPYLIESGNYYSRASSELTNALRGFLNSWAAYANAIDLA